MEMAMRPTRLFTAVSAAFLLVCGIPAAALAESDVVLSNESEGTEVNSGDSTFNNSEDISSGSTSFSSGDSDSIDSTQTAGDASTGVPTSEQIRRIAPGGAAGPSVPTAEAIRAEVARATRSVDALFVGFSIADGSISP
jgi:hypothetical protein